MREITNEEFIVEVDNGAGVCSYMGGYKSTNRYEIIIVCGKNFLFNPEEVGGEGWGEKMKDVIEESKNVYEDNFKSMG